MGRDEAVEGLLYLCDNFNVEEPFAFARLLQAATKVYPVIDQEIASIYGTTASNTSLWVTGSIIPDRSIQSNVVEYIQRRIADERKVYANAIEKGYDITLPAPVVDNVPESVPFYLPWYFKLRSWVEGVVSFFGSSDISSENFSSLIERTHKSREGVFKIRLNRQIKRCNRRILKAIKKNEMSLMYKVGIKSMETVKIANSMAEYLNKTGSFTATVTYDYVLWDKGAVFLEISFYD